MQAPPVIEADDEADWLLTHVVQVAGARVRVATIAFYCLQDRPLAAAVRHGIWTAWVERATVGRVQRRGQFAFDGVEGVWIR